MRLLLAILFTCGLCCACTEKDRFRVSASNKNITYWGRVEKDSNHTKLFWSGSSIRIKFKGSDLSAVFNDERGENDLNIIIDDATPILLELDKGQHTYEIANSLDTSIHTVVLFKRTEWDRGDLSFLGFTSNFQLELLPVEPKKRSIVFYGNSITAGYAVEDTTGKDNPSGTFTNNYNTYARLTATHFDSEYRCIVKSGIGITVSWFPLIMPEMFDRLNPSDSSSKWDFTNYQPDIVVVNLLQNDSWLVNMPNYPEHKARFKDIPATDSTVINAYISFVKTLRSKYPTSEIICSLGSMDATKKGSPWPGLVDQVIIKLNDEHLHTHFFTFKGPNGHPNTMEQALMANSLIGFIDRKDLWY